MGLSLVIFFGKFDRFIRLAHFKPTFHGGINTKSGMTAGEMTTRY